MNLISSTDNTTYKRMNSQSRTRADYRDRLEILMSKTSTDIGKFIGKIKDVNLSRNMDRMLDFMDK